MKIRISIRRKILLTFALFFLVSLLLALYGYYKYHVLNQKIHLVENKETLLNSILEARRYEKNFFITQEGRHLEKALQYTDKSTKDLIRLIEGFNEKALPRNIERQMAILKQYQASLRFLLENDPNSTASPDPSSASRAEVLEKTDRISSLGRELTMSVEAALQQERTQIKHLVFHSRQYLFVFLGLIALIACVMFVFLIQNVDKPLKTIEEAINRIVVGDYQDIPEIRSGDEFEKLVDSLNTMLMELSRRNNQLLQNEKMAALGTLTSGVAHELNNPLNNISTSLQIILEEIEDGDIGYQRELLSESEEEVRRAQEIVKALLEFSRETEFSLSRENVAGLVRSTLKLIQGEIPSRVQVSLDIPEKLNAEMDTRRIQQVLLNLVINACHAMEESGGELTIKAFERKDGQGFFLQVQDAGHGIGPAKLSKIFDPFYTTKELGKGSGLGLSVSKGIVESHKGNIEVWSREGQGTVFTVFLPYSPREFQTG